MDPISSGSGTNPINNPRVDLLHNTGGNQQLGGAAGAYGPSPMSSSIPGAAPMPGAPTGGGPSSASSYVSSAQGARPAAMSGASVPPPAPRPAATAPLYASSVPSGGGDGGGIGLGLIIGAVVVILLLLGGTYALFSSQLNNQNKQLQAAIADVKNNGSQSGDIKSNTIDNADKITTKTLEVTENADGVDALTVNGASNLQGPVKTGGDLSVGGNLNVTGDATVSGTLNAGKFVGDGSGLTGVGGGGAAGGAGPAGPRGATGPAGAPNPNAINALHADYASGAANSDKLEGLSAANFIQLQTPSTTTGLVQQTGSLAVSESLVGGKSVIIGNNTTGEAATLGYDTPTGDLIIGTQNRAAALRIVDGCDPTILLTTCTGLSGTLTVSNGTTNTVVGGGGIVTPGLASTGSIAAVSGITGGSFTTSGAINGGAISGSSLSATGNVGGATGTINGNSTFGPSLSAKLQISAVGGTAISTDGDINVNGNISTNGSTGITTNYGTFASSITAGRTVTVGDVGVGQEGSLLVKGSDTNISSITIQDGYITANCAGPCQANQGVIKADDHFSAQNHLGVDHLNACTSVEVYGGIVTGCNAGSDYAELYPSTQNLAAGMVVAIDPANPEGVIATTYANQSTAIGVVSTQPGAVVGEGNTKVALSGRVPVKVEGDAIAAGDYVTSSSTPGYARKAAAGEKTIGQALSGFSGGQGTVTIFVSVSNGGATQTDVQTPVATQQQGQANNQFADLNASGTATIGILNVTGVATIATLNVTGLATVQNIQVNGHIIGNTNTRGSLIIPAGGTTATAPLSGFTAVPVAVASPVTDSVPYKVTTTTSGVTVTIETPAAADIKFNYLVQQ